MPGGMITERRAMAKAAAWYYVCYSPTEECETYQIGTTKARFLSFAWIPMEYLLQWLERRANRGQSPGRALGCIGRSFLDLFANERDALSVKYGDHLTVRQGVSCTVGRKQESVCAEIFWYKVCMAMDKASFRCLMCYPVEFFVKRGNLKLNCCSGQMK